jgi:very-short-patch-repair endonuclease/predicted transcriptional regulator of viral defense system
MDRLTLQDADALVGELGAAQHWVVTHEQLQGLGLGADSVGHRVKTGRLHPVYRGVYAIGRPALEQQGRWMAAVLACGDEALLSHRSAAALWGLARNPAEQEVEVVTPDAVLRGRPGIRVHRRADLRAEHRREVDGIPVTDPISTLVDLASCAPEWQVEQAINAADRLGLVDSETLRAAVPRLAPRPGKACIRRLAGCDALTDTGLERKFLAIVRSANLPSPRTQAMVNGYRVDFYWPDLGLVVETDGWRYHRTPGEQATDQRRDQAHARRGLTALRFGESQIRNEPRTVQRTLKAVVHRILKG